MARALDPAFWQGRRVLVTGHTGFKGSWLCAWLHRLGARKLGVLTVLHNYWLKRRDGTTAAERLFGKKPADLFEWLLARLPLPPRPARQRSRAA